MLWKLIVEKKILRQFILFFVGKEEREETKKKSQERKQKEERKENLLQERCGDKIELEKFWRMFTGPSSNYDKSSSGLNFQNFIDLETVSSFVHYKTAIAFNLPVYTF